MKRHLESQHKSVFFTLYVKTSEDCVGELPAITGNKRTREEIEELPDQGPLRTKKSRNFFLQKTLPETLENGQKLPIHSDKAQFKSTPIYSDHMQGIAQFLNIEEQMLSNSAVPEHILGPCLHDRQKCELNSRLIRLNPNISYIVFMMDRKLQSFTEVPGEITRTVLTLNPLSGYVRIFLKVYFINNL